MINQTLTNLNPLWTNVKDANHASDESSDGFEVQTTNTP